MFNLLNGDETDATLYSGNLVIADGVATNGDDFTLMASRSFAEEVVYTRDGMPVSGTLAVTQGRLDDASVEVSGMSLIHSVPASYVMAKAGLLDGKRATIHWENHDSFTEEFDEVELTKSVFVVDGNRMSTAGGTSSIDLMLKLIADEHGEQLANAVADQMIYSSIRTDQDTQRLSVPTRIGVRHPKLSQVIQMMEQNIEEPISPSILAKDVGMSTRQLERLFRRYLNRSPKRYYMELRLQKARNLLMQTDMTVINVALACGFASPSHFSKCYRSHYNTTPYRERGSQAARLSV